MEAEGQDPAAGGANPFGGADAAGGAGGADPAAGGAPDAAMTPEQDPESDAQSAENQQKENTDNLKQTIVELISFLDQSLKNPNGIPKELKDLVAELRDISDINESQAYIDEINKKFSKETPSDNVQYFRKSN